MRADPHSRVLRRGRNPASGIWFAVTTAVLDRRPILGLAEGQLVIESLLWLRRRGRAAVHAFVVLPDHVHVMLAPGGARSISEVMGTWKKYSALAIGKLRGERGGVWQEGFYDHAIRDLRDAIHQHRYLIENPVRLGLARSPEEFELSSAHPRFAGELDDIR